MPREGSSFSYGGIIRIRYKGQKRNVFYLSRRPSAPLHLFCYHNYNAETRFVKKKVRVFRYQTESGISAPSSLSAILLYALRNFGPVEESSEATMNDVFLS